jgi:hypothetical protein
MAMSNAESKRQERLRKRYAGLVPKEVWIKPKWTTELRRIEKIFRGDCGQGASESCAGQPSEQVTYGVDQDRGVVK